MQEFKGYGILGFVFICLTLLACCTERPVSPQINNQNYRTPIPEGTIKAYREGTPIANKLQAVIAAQAILSTLRMEDIQPPEVIYVQRMTLTEAKKKSEKPGEESFFDIPPETPVWFVIFKGNWQVHPPLPGITATPPEPIQGCLYIWVAEANNGFAATGDIDCTIE